MFRTLTTVLSLTVLSLAIGCSRAEFKEFSPPGSGFKVQMPGTPKDQSTTAAGIQMKAFVTEERNGAYFVSYADLPIPPNESPAQIQTRLDGSRDGSLSNIGGKLASESKIQLSGKYPGRDIRAEVPSKKMFAREQVFIVDRRLYSLIALGTQSWVNSAESNKFFDSFALLASSTMTESLLPQRFVFRFSAPCRYRDPLWKASRTGLDEKYRLVNLAELDDQPAMAEVSAAWSEAGLVFAYRSAERSSRSGAGPRVRRTATACKSGSTPATYTTSTVPAASATVYFSAQWRRPQVRRGLWPVVADQSCPRTGPAGSRGALAGPQPASAGWLSFGMSCSGRGYDGL